MIEVKYFDMMEMFKYLIDLKYNKTLLVILVRDSKFIFVILSKPFRLSSTMELCWRSKTLKLVKYFVNVLSIRQNPSFILFAPRKYSNSLESNGLQFCRLILDAPEKYFSLVIFLLDRSIW